MSTSTRNEVRTSVIGEAPEITAPVRLEGQSNSEVLFNWLVVNRCLWMLEDPFDTTLEQIVGTSRRFRLGFMLIQWRRLKRREHPSLAAPESNEDRIVAFARLDRLIRIHLLDGNSSNR